jgi:hypothetical protein
MVVKIVLKINPLNWLKIGVSSTVVEIVSTLV